MIKEAIEKIVSKQDLTYDEAYTVMNEIMNGETTQVQNAAYLAALSTKSTKAETIDEISGSAMAMRDHALKVEHAMDVLDIVGTGGDHAHSINISTTAAMSSDSVYLRSCSRRQSRQARQPRRFLEVRCRRLPRSARRQPRPAAR